MFYCYWFSLSLDSFIFHYAINLKNKGTNVIVVHRDCGKGDDEASAATILVVMCQDYSRIL